MHRKAPWRGLVWKVAMFFVGAFLGSLSFAQSHPIWARTATPLCNGANQSVSAPSKSTLVNIICRVDAEGTTVVRLQVIHKSGSFPEVQLREGADELLWAPNSKAFFVNGGQSAYAGFFVDVFTIGKNGLELHDTTQNAQRNMATTFPPCEAANHDLKECLILEKEPDFNMSGVGWTADSALLVFAEVPCSSSYGGIMCQVLGFQVSVPDGRIQKRLTAHEIKSEWQAKLAWKMRIPDDPIYEKSTAAGGR